jgi:hypothetical protein
MPGIFSEGGMGSITKDGSKTVYCSWVCTGKALYKEYGNLPLDINVRTELERFNGKPCQTCRTSLRIRIASSAGQVNHDLIDEPLQ